ncbi:hypothetical protein CFK41_13130 [Brachybacterium ginsengisoli]|uniref:Leucine rich repeat variant domain-containing protein n=1 Tax=Brachybacterium ginsengisoli TaxID=1331682 RepID=A0A291GZG8_9MICO|nr:hypothetical protein [Brachybacterium ginsengisoli]ATG55611.1 hypothetical protein CFK41_13130 [Brachybacterium ginsengisoli]
MAEPRSAAQEASDPSTRPERLVELTEKHPQLQKLIVLNPSCPEVARQWILATNPWAKQAYEASLASEQEEPDEPEPDESSVWGDLGASSAAVTDTAPQEIPEEAPTSSVRIAPDAGVVPLGASSPVSPAPVSPASAPPPVAAAAPTSSTAPVAAGAAGGAGGAVAWTPEGEPDDGSRTRRRTWYACGGCLLLALLLVILIALVGRAWLGGDDDEYQRDSSTTAQESPSEEPTEKPTTAESTTPDPVSPAPEDAREMTELRSPTGNISCMLEKDSVACSVKERDYGQNGQEDCSEGPFSVQVSGGETSAACGSSFLSDSAETLQYGESAKNGSMACTSRSEGMTCWNTITGKGFMVNRAEYDTF